jgi:hypothetical protein
VKVLSLGGGVQSSALLLMAIYERMEPIDAVLFADTGWEPQGVYDYIAYLRAEHVKDAIPFYTVKAGDLRADALGKAAGVKRRFASLPLYALSPDGKKSILPRQCTSQYKLGPINRQLRLLGATRKNPVEVWIGISQDERIRMKDSRVQYVRNRWPLVEQQLRRYDCLHWLTEQGIPEPPKSSCIGCPFHGNAYWRAMRDNQPGEWADAVAFDASIRHIPGIKGTCYVHRDCVPLDKVDLSTRLDHGQLPMFDRECEGLCGI